MRAHPSRSLWIRLDGQRVFGLVLGRARERLPVVLVPGLGLSHRYMQPLAGLLAEHTQVFLFDPPGTGRSDTPSHAIGVTEQADLLARWMAAVGVRRAVLVGNSLGCHVIVRLAQRHPERVAKAVLIGMPLSPWARSVWQQFVRLVQAGLHEPLSLWRLVVRDYLRARPWRLARTFQLAAGECSERWLSQVEAPVLVVRGTRDPLLDARWARQIVETVPEGELVELPGLAHAAHFEAPEQVAPLVVPLLERAPHPFLASVPCPQPTSASTQS